MYRTLGEIFATDAANDDGLDVQRALIADCLDAERDRARIDGRLYTAMARIDSDCSRRAGEDDELYERLLRSAYEDLALAVASSPTSPPGPSARPRNCAPGSPAPSRRCAPGTSPSTRPNSCSAPPGP
ncbi:MAG: hypothetical protein ACT4QF_14785 [Sporichthyaceae bacterium]